MLMDQVGKIYMYNQILDFSINKEAIWRCQMVKEIKSSGDTIQLKKQSVNLKTEQ
jgi:hypothetical protein